MAAPKLIDIDYDGPQKIDRYDLVAEIASGGMRPDRDGPPDRDRGGGGDGFDEDVEDIPDLGNEPPIGIGDDE